MRNVRAFHPALIEILSTGNVGTTEAGIATSGSFQLVGYMMSDVMRDNEPDTKIITVLEVRYRGKVLFSHVFDGVLNEMDLNIDTDLRQVQEVKK